MALTDEYLRGIEEHDLPELREQLAQLEDGSIRLSERHGGGPWVEATHQWIDHFEKDHWHLRNHLV